MSALAFANIGMLVALLALPAIWYFLRLTPPKPRTEEFPPTRLLLRIAPKEEQPARSPWWLTALRLLLATLVILALAGPIYNPLDERLPGDGPLLLVVDNSWSSAAIWTKAIEGATRAVDLAEADNRPIALVATADAASEATAAADAETIRAKLGALAPRPWKADPAEVGTAMGSVTSSGAIGGVLWLTAPLADETTAAVAGAILQGSNDIVAYTDHGSELALLGPPISGAQALDVPVYRVPTDEPLAGVVRGRDIQGRVIGETAFEIAAGAGETAARFDLPVELRNDIVRLEMAGVESAGAVQLIDDRWQRRRVGLLSGASLETAQPLLSPLHYISQAIGPFADVSETRESNAAIAVADLVDAGVAVIAMADIGNIPVDVEEKVAEWVRKGGTLVRFAGPRLAADSDSLIPVSLRSGDRILGGSLSWQTPQPLGSFTDHGPFAGLPVPDEILVNRQVLAEPDGLLGERTWAALADGTPLVTAAQQGRGWLVLFHVTADTSWSNLPLSGTFVEMLRRIVAFSANVSAGGGGDGDQPVPPYRLLDGFGHFTDPGVQAEPLSGSLDEINVDAEHPPGLYGTEEGFRALNLFREAVAPTRIDLSALETVTESPYPTDSPTNLAPWLLAAALALLAIDTLAVLWLSGGLAWLAHRRATVASLALAAVVALGVVTDGRADEASDRFAIEAVSSTRLAYVLTGDAEIDGISRAGLMGLSRVLADRTALEPGDPIGVDPGRDELAFFPLIYWPIVPEAELPGNDAMARLEAYMRQGGSVLFDTRDQLQRTTSFTSLGGTPAVERLRILLANLDIPPLEPVPADHVLTKAFYLLTEFPGRYAGGPLWVEALPDDVREDRPARAGDGVSTILITSNDLAGAWAIDDQGAYRFATVPPDRIQREMSLRAGVNIVMYTLTGNYKADQVHVPALLERLGQ